MTDQLPVSREAVAQIIRENVADVRHTGWELQVADALLAAFSFGASSVGPSPAQQDKNF